MSDYGTTWEDIEPTRPHDMPEPEKKEYVERVAVFMSEDMLTAMIADYDYWARQLSHGDTLDSIRRGLEYKEIADNLREYID